MKISLVALAVLAACMVYGEETKSSDSASPKINKKELLMLRSGGGKVEKAGTKKGVVTVVNAQQGADRKWIEDSIGYLKRETRLNIVLQDGTFAISNPTVVGDLTVFVADDPKLPSLLVAPENRWALVNVAPLKSEKLAFYENRVKKEVSRAFAMLCAGMAGSAFEMSLVGPVSKASDLDKYPNAQLPFDVLNRIPQYTKSFGVVPAEVATYRRACMEGWAPAPQTEVQKIIWEEMHAKPTEPMRIKFDPKQGE